MTLTDELDNPTTPPESPKPQFSDDEAAKLKALLSAPTPAPTKQQPAPPVNQGQQNVADAVRAVLDERESKQKLEERLRNLEAGSGGKKRKPWYVPFSPFGG